VCHCFAEAVFSLEEMPRTASAKQWHPGTKKTRLPALPRTGGAQKKPPERPRPRGAEDTIRFRERLDRSQPAQRARLPGQSGRPVDVTEAHREASVPAATRFSGRRHTASAGGPDADPFSMGSPWLPAAARPWAALRLTREAARIWNLAFRVKGGFRPV